MGVLPARLPAARARAVKTVRRLFLAKLTEAHAAGRLTFFGDHAGLSERCAFVKFLAPPRRKNWFVYAKPPFAGPEAVLAYLSRYTHRVAIANSRLIALDEAGVTFRRQALTRRNGKERYLDDYAGSGRVHPPLPAPCLARRASTASATTDCLPAPTARTTSRALANFSPRPSPRPNAAEATTPQLPSPDDRILPCPCCGGRMVIIETFERGGLDRAPLGRSPSGARAL